MTDHSDLTAVIAWLEAGCDPAEAAKELRSYQEALSSQSLSLSEARAENERLRERNGFLERTRGCDMDQFVAMGLARDDATRQRDEALAALKASEEIREAAQRVIAEGRITSGGVRRPAKWIQVPANVWSRLQAALSTTAQDRLPEHADATNNPPSDPGTEQREAGAGPSPASAPCPHAPTYDAGLCCGHPDDCTFVSPSNLLKEKDDA